MRLYKDQSACGNKDKSDDMCGSCMRAYPDDDHRLFSNFITVTAEKKIVQCDGYIKIVKWR